MMDTISDVLRILTAAASLGAVIMGIINSRRIKEVHISVNSRMDQLLSEKGDASRAAGFREGQQDGKSTGNGNDYIVGRLKQ